MAVAKTNLDSAARPRLVGEGGRHCVIEQFVDWDGQCHAGDIVAGGGE